MALLFALLALASRIALASPETDLADFMGSDARYYVRLVPTDFPRFRDPDTYRINVFGSRRALQVRAINLGEQSLTMLWAHSYVLMPTGLQRPMLEVMGEACMPGEVVVGDPLSHAETVVEPGKEYWEQFPPFYGLHGDVVEVVLKVDYAGQIHGHRWAFAFEFDAKRASRTLCPLYTPEANTAAVRKGAIKYGILGAGAGGVAGGVSAAFFLIPGANQAANFFVPFVGGVAIGTAAGALATRHRTRRAVALLEPLGCQADGTIKLR